MGKAVFRPNLTLPAETQSHLFEWGQSGIKAEGANAKCLGCDFQQKC